MRLVEVAAACVGAIIYTGLGLFGISRMWASRFSVKTKQRSPYLAVLSGTMNVAWVATVFVQMATRSAGRAFPCGITVTLSHLYVLLCALPLILRETGDSAIYATRISPTIMAKSPLVATGGRRYPNSQYTAAARTSTYSSTFEPSTEGTSGEADSSSDDERPSAQHALRAKFAAVALVVVIGAVTAILIGESGGGWSIRGRVRDGACLPLESWHVLASWAACVMIDACAYATTVEPEKIDPRTGKPWRKRRARQRGASLADGATGTAPRYAVTLHVSRLWPCRRRRQSCFLRGEKLLTVMVSSSFGGVYFALLWRQPNLTVGQEERLLLLLVVMNASLLLSTFWLSTRDWMSRRKPIGVADFAKLQRKWGSTKNVMRNANMAAMLRDAAKAHFCEELYKFLAAFQQFESMNIDEAEDCGAGSSGGSTASSNSVHSHVNSRRFRPSIFSLRAEQPSQQPSQQPQAVEQHCAYQVPRYSEYLGILGEFFTPGCRHEVNVSSETRLQVAKARISLRRFCDWVASSENDKRILFSKAVHEVRMMLDQNIMGSFINSPSFAGVAQELMKVKSAQDEIAAEEEEKRLAARKRMKTGIQAITLANSVRRTWVSAVSERSDVDEGARGGGADTQDNPSTSTSGADSAPIIPLRLRTITIGALAAGRLTTAGETAENGGSPQGSTKPLEAALVVSTAPLSTLAPSRGSSPRTEPRRPLSFRTAAHGVLATTTRSPSARVAGSPPSSPAQPERGDEAAGCKDPEREAA
ncbi:unnamed protein product [Ectocarpus sp. 6 AP-2014]